MNTAFFYHIVIVFVRNYHNMVKKYCKTYVYHIVGYLGNCEAVHEMLSVCAPLVDPSLRLIDKLLYRMHLNYWKSSNEGFALQSNMGSEMNRQPGAAALSLLISRKILKIWTWNFDTMLIQIWIFSYQNLEWTYLIVWKVCAFRHRRNFIFFLQITPKAQRFF